MLDAKEQVGPIEGLTERQKREREYYNVYSSVHESAPINLEPFIGQERRPWNSYWQAYRIATDLFQKPGQSLLEFGTGTGQTAVALATVGYEVSAFDISENQIAVCNRQKAQSEFASRLHFSVQRAEKLEYPANSFDCVLGIDILHHIEIGPSVREAHRVLKPGGVAIFREWIEVPIFDTLRNSWPVTVFFPTEASFEEHRTEDERKLNQQDLQRITSIFPNATFYRFGITSRIRRLFPIKGAGPCVFQKFDHSLLRLFPSLGIFGGEILMVLKKE